MSNYIKQIIKEEVSKSEVKDEIKSTINSKKMEDIIIKVIEKKLKNNKELENDMVDIAKNVVTQLFKTLWVKRSFWRDTLKNKAS